MCEDLGCHCFRLGEKFDSNLVLESLSTNETNSTTAKEGKKKSPSPIFLPEPRIPRPMSPGVPLELLAVDSIDPGVL